MKRALHQAYRHMKVLFDPAMEGGPYDRYLIARVEKHKTGYRYHLPKVSKQFIVR